MALTPHSVLRSRITRHLASGDGAALRRDVLAALEDAYGDLWTQDDLLPQATRPFETKWRNRVSFERQRMVEAGLLEARADGVWALTPTGWDLAHSLSSTGASHLDVEISRRAHLWDAIRSNGDPSNIPPERIRDVGLYSGARGIYVDVDRTRSEIAPEGIALTFLDLGVRYSNELSDKGVIYHFPFTKRRGRDRAEVAATQRAFELGVPVFVLTLAEGNKETRAVHRAFVEEIDATGATALITFIGDDELPPAPPSEQRPFELTDEGEEVRWSRRRARPNQSRFAFKVFQRYGYACFVCGLGVKSALEAAHLRAKATAGADDERNGLPLCSNHHRMFDAYLWAIDPGSYAVEPRPGLTLDDLAIGVTTVAGRIALPHVDALQHAWQTWRRKNRIAADAG